MRLAMNIQATMDAKIAQRGRHPAEGSRDASPRPFSHRTDKSKRTSLNRTGDSRSRTTRDAKLRRFCGAVGDRTPDLRTASAALSQLSYSPEGSGTLAENLFQASKFGIASVIKCGRYRRPNRLIGQRYRRAADGASAGMVVVPLGASPVLQRAANQPRTKRNRAKPTQVSHAGVFGSLGGMLSTMGLEGSGAAWGSEWSSLMARTICSPRTGRSRFFGWASA
jgi:hypothetical protein